MVVHPHRVSRLLLLLGVLRERILPYVRMYSFLAVAGEPMPWFWPGCLHPSSPALACDVSVTEQLEDARSRASTFLDKGRYDITPTHPMYLIHRLQLRYESVV